MKPTDLRQAAKPIRFHLFGCRFDYTATCTCGQEPYYTPGLRVKRGEIYMDGTVARHTDNHDPGDEDRRGS